MGPAVRDAVGARPDRGDRDVQRLAETLDDLASPLGDPVLDRGPLEHPGRPGALALGPPRRAQLHDLAHLVSEPLQQAGVSSASGWVTQRLGGFPREGDVVPIGNFVLRVEETRGARVTRLRLTRTNPGAVSPPQA